MGIVTFHLYIKDKDGRPFADPIKEVLIDLPFLPSKGDDISFTTVEEDDIFGVVFGVWHQTEFPITVVSVSINDDDARYTNKKFRREHQEHNELKTDWREDIPLV